LLNVVAGFSQATEGEALLDGAKITGPGSDRGVVFQQYSLFPWMSVRKNVEFGLKMQGVAITKRETTARTLLGLAGLLAFENHYPDQLSGGMKQRVGIARAFAIQPKMLLLDEPFGALDALTRGTIQDELMGIVRETQQTVFMITHDVDEAILLADRILLMSNGNEGPNGYVAGGMAEVVVNPLPRQRSRAQLHHLDGYYDLRNHVVDFLVSRAKAH
jgi:nitrate/nitrite transport system ATP-binding protein